MKLTALSITRPLAVTMAIVALVLMGLIAHARLAVDLLPSVSLPFVSVSIGYLGASPTDIETLISKPMENAVSGLLRVNHVNSTSVEGQGRVSIQFTDGTNVDFAAIDVERVVSSLRATLPADALAPSVQKFDPSQQSIMLVTLSGSRTPEQLFNLADQTIKPRLEGVDGVANVSLFGGLARELSLQVDSTRMAAHNVTLSQVTRALQQGNQTQPSGAIEKGTQRYDVRVVGEARTPAELGQIVIAPGVRINDVAAVRDTFKPPTVLTPVNGHEGVALAV